jgi:long-chain acyl-CoA synthetase
LEALTEDGWLKSGDVGAILPSNKGLKIIDRKKNIFKLSQGEYVAAEKVENFYLNYPMIAEIFLHGESSQSFAIVFVCPDKKRL